MELGSGTDLGFYNLYNNKNWSSLSCHWSDLQPCEDKYFFVGKVILTATTVDTRTMVYCNLGFTIE